MDISTPAVRRLIRLPLWAGILLFVSIGIPLAIAGYWLVSQTIQLDGANWNSTLIVAIGVTVFAYIPVAFWVVSVIHGLDVARADALKLANIDILTGLLNRRRFLDLANNELMLSRRSQLAITVLLLDVDDFKKINDLYGHDVGDAVLTMIARTCADALRPEDLLARWGGEEFVAILPGANQLESIGIALRLRDAIASSTVRTGDNTIAATVSIGVAAELDSRESLGSMITRADLAMYQAKREGKNAAVLAPPLTTPERQCA